MGASELGGRWQKLRKYMRENAIPICWICGNHIDLDLPSKHPRSFSVDHYVPVSVDETLAYELSNLRVACFGCNSSRGARMDSTTTTCKTTIDW